MQIPKVIRGFVAASALVVALAGQSALAQTYGIIVNQQATSTDVPEGGSVTFAATNVGASNDAVVTLTNRAGVLVQMNTLTLTGSSDFSLVNAPELPFSLNPTQSISLVLRHNPTTSNRTTGLLNINSSVNSQSRTTLLNLAGTAPEFVFSYTPQGGNASNITSGSTLTFPATAIDATSNATVVITNRGTAPGIVQSISVGGANFAGIGLPLPSTTVNAGSTLPFTVQFTAKSLEAAVGSMSITAAGAASSFTLQGTGTGANFTYNVVNGSQVTPVNPGGLIVVPDAVVNEKTSVTVRVRNNGNADTRITALAINGAGYSITDGPLIPVTVPIGGQIAFTLNFAPTTTGRAAGRLRVGDIDFEVTSNGLGANLTYSFSAAGTPTTVTNAGTVNFLPARVGESNSITFTATNSGTSASTINAIGLTAASTVFTLSQTPTLPAQLAPGASVSFSVQFAPAAQGASTATLKVDNASFTLNGFGEAPAPLPTLRFTGTTGAQEALQQPAIGLAIASAYRTNVTGTLTLAFNSDVFSNDPSVQFATGGRTVAFTIPAGQTAALFPNGANTIRVQTGSVAGTITLTPTVATEGGFNLTPTQPPALNLTVASAAPRILSAIVASKAAAAITLQVSGYSTARSVTQIDLTLTGVSGENVATQRLTLPVESAFLGWYQGTSSGQFGSLFTVTIPLSLAGEVNTSGLALSDTIQSIGVTIGNRIGTSAATTVALK
ncbi:MAG: choice-of-anchor D domain-containing protein [Acidobacteriota bacterium]